MWSCSGVGVTLPGDVPTTVRGRVGPRNMYVKEESLYNKLGKKES